jgi:hypothetical protein
MEINITTFLAVWGALLSTFAIGWNVYRDFSEKGRLKVDCYIGKSISDLEGISKQDYLIWSITNVGNRSVIISNIGGAFTDCDFMLNTRNRMPHKLNSGEYIIEYSPDLSILTKNIKELFVIDTIGKKYKASNKRLKQAIQSAKKKVGAKNT